MEGKQLRSRAQPATISYDSVLKAEENIWDMLVFQSPCRTDRWRPMPNVGTQLNGSLK